MKKFIFTLQKVLDFKNQNLELQTGELHKLINELNQIENAIDCVRRDYDNRTTAIEAEMSEGISIQKLSICKSYINLLIKKQNELMTKKVNFESVIEKKKEEIIAIKSEISGLEKLKDKQYNEYNKLSQKMLDIDVEEYVVRKSG